MIPGEPDPWSSQHRTIQRGVTTAPNQTSAKKTSVAGYWISAVVLVLGCGGAAVWFVASIVGVVSKVADYERTTIPGQITKTFEEGTQTVFYEVPSMSGRTYRYQPPEIRVWHGHQRVPLEQTYMSSTYSWDATQGESIAEFDVDSAGVYRIEVLGEPQPAGYGVAVGQDPVMSAVGGFIGSMVLGGVAFVVAATILAVTIVRRGRDKRGPQPPMPAFGAPGAYPVPGRYPGSYPPSGYSSPMTPGPNQPSPGVPGQYPSGPPTPGVPPPPPPVPGSYSPGQYPAGPSVPGQYVPGPYPTGNPAFGVWPPPQPQTPQPQTPQPQTPQPQTPQPQTPQPQTPQPQTSQPQTSQPQTPQPPPMSDPPVDPPGNPPADPPAPRPAEPGEPG